MQLSPRCRAIISGEAQDLNAILQRMVLQGFCASLYSVVIRIRNHLYDSGLLRVTRLPVPVVCVGNITVGGTGKTPMALLICRFFQQQGIKVVLISRGYRGRGRENDEIRLVQEALPDVPIVFDGDRVRAGRKAIAEHQAQVLVLDDGFQHRRLHRDLDIVLLDCTCPFGYFSVLPGGLLREPVSSLRRADAIILTRTNQVTLDMLRSLREKVEQLLQNPGNNKDRKEKFIASSEHKPVKLVSATGEELPVTALQGKRVAAFAGIGNPDSFYRTLMQLGAEVIAEHSFADHHDYTNKDGLFLQEMMGRKKADWLITTEKDWVKLRDLPDITKLEGLCRLKIELVLKDGREEFFSLLRSKVLTGNRLCMND